MTENSQATVYSEIYGILNSLDVSYTNAIPKKLYNLIKEKREKNYNPTYNMDIPLSQQNISKKATAFICMLHYNYWCTSEEEKEKINKILKYNTEKNKDKYFEYERKFNSNTAKKNDNKKIEKDTSINQNKTALVVKKENTWFKRFLKFIRNIFIK